MPMELPNECATVISIRSMMGTNTVLELVTVQSRVQLANAIAPHSAAMGGGRACWYI